MLQKIIEDRKPNQSMIFGYLYNAMTTNVKYPIKASIITTL